MGEREKELVKLASVDGRGSQLLRIFRSLSLIVLAHILHWPLADVRPRNPTNQNETIDLTTNRKHKNKQSNRLTENQQ